jgi:hypothetical protein
VPEYKGLARTYAYMMFRHVPIEIQESVMGAFVGDNTQHIIEAFAKVLYYRGPTDDPFEAAIRCVIENNIEKFDRILTSVHCYALDDSELGYKPTNFVDIIAVYRKRLQYMFDGNYIPTEELARYEDPLYYVKREHEMVKNKQVKCATSFSISTKNGSNINVNIGNTPRWMIIKELCLSLNDKNVPDDVSFKTVIAGNNTDPTDDININAITINHTVNGCRHKYSVNKLDINFGDETFVNIAGFKKNHPQLDVIAILSKYIVHK